MAHNSSKSGFTLLEILVASLLLGMLVTILTMVFNSSSIAWRTGKAGVAQLSRLRRQLSIAQYRADNVLPGVSANNENDVGIIVSPWSMTSVNGGYLRSRAVQKFPGANFDVGFSNFKTESESCCEGWRQVTGLGTYDLGSSKAYTVGVLSLGPDGKRDTDDDITTWPGKVE